jgi:hypothetical protein
MTNLLSIQACNRELARQINEEARANPQSPYAGKFVGIANGQVVIVSDNMEEAARLLRQADPDPRKLFFLEAGQEDAPVEEIWSC